MRRLTSLVVAVVALSALSSRGAARATEPGGIVVLSAGEPARETVLVETLRIYTRDLGRSVRLGGAAPASLATDELERVATAAAQNGDDVVVWFGVRDGAPVLLALRVATRDLRETPVTGEAQDSARTLALKVRALCTPSPAPPEWTTPPEAAPPSNTENPPPTTPATTNPPATATTKPPLATALIRHVPERVRATIVDLEAQYQLIVPTTPEWLRQGLLIRASFPLGRVPLALFADAAFTTAPSLAVDASVVSARVWPVAIGLAYRLARPRWHVAVGPRASLQVVTVDARTPDNRTGGATTFSAGLGAYGEGAWMFSRYVGLVVAVSVEALVPRQQFVAGPGPGATDLGWAQLGFSAGFVVSIP